MRVPELHRHDMRSILYITYDGLLEPLGQSQVLAYLSHLAVDHRIHVLSFEKPADRLDTPAVQGMQARLDSLGIGWTALTYHKKPSAPATAYDIAVGTMAGMALAIRKKASILHARSYVPALIALPIRWATRAKLVFDMRGFWADERVDGGLWPRDGVLYRTTKRLEDRFLRAADHIVTLTAASATELARFPSLQAVPKPISVIPTCADLARFQPSASGPAQDFVFGYVGSVGHWYLFEETLAFFKALLARRSDARFLVVNRREHDLVRTLAAKVGVPADRIELVAARHGDVPSLVQRMHLGAALVRPSYSKVASAPTKMAEYLGCGVPCLGNAGVGDVAEILEQRRVGVVMREFAQSDIERAAEQALRVCEEDGLSARCVATARDLFSLEHGVASYRRIYESLVPEAIDHESIEPGVAKRHEPHDSPVLRK